MVRSEGHDQFAAGCARLHDVVRFDDLVEPEHACRIGPQCPVGYGSEDVGERDLVKRYDGEPSTNALP
jgi:hypothetical protein